MVVWTKPLFSWSAASNGVTIWSWRTTTPELPRDLRPRRDRLLCTLLRAADRLSCLEVPHQGCQVLLAKGFGRRFLRVLRWDKSWELFSFDHYCRSYIIDVWWTWRKSSNGLLSVCSPSRLRRLYAGICQSRGEAMVWLFQKNPRCFGKKMGANIHII